MIGLLDANVLIALFVHRHMLTPKHLTDFYLLALAAKKGGRLVTFDRGIPIAAVVGADAEHLVVLGAPARERAV